MRQPRRRFGFACLALCGAIAAAVPAPGQAPQPLPQPIYLQPPPQQAGPEVQTVVNARQSLDEFCNLQIESIPPAMLHAAEGVAIFPNMVKGGFILGVNYGRGVLLVRKADRTWSAPAIVTMGGGSLGFQAGVQAADIVLVFATPKSLQGILAGQKVTLGADASVALGPVGRQANAGTDARLGAEIYSYARSRGLFAGVSVGGADLSIDDNADAALYGRFGVTPADVFNGQQLQIRPEVQQLIDDLNARTRPQPAAQAGPLQAAPPAATAPPAGPGLQPIATAPPAGLQPLPSAPPAMPQPGDGSLPPLVPIQP
jgi:lipid-binding SYLF domain-containing protein